MIHSDHLEPSDVPSSRNRPAVSAFAATFDSQTVDQQELAGRADLDRLRNNWLASGTLPWDLDLLRVWLRREVPGWRHPTGAIRDDLLVMTIVDRIRVIARARKHRLQLPIPKHELIARTPMLERYLRVTEASHKERLEMAEADRRDPTALIADFLDSTAAFESYKNIDEAFHDEREPPVAGACLWRTDDIGGRLHPNRALRFEREASDDETQFGMTFVDREITVARTKQNMPTHTMQRVEMIELDLLLRSHAGGLPVVAELKTPTDEDRYYALIQVLAGASQLATPNQIERLRRQYRGAAFADETDGPRVDCALFFVDPVRCHAIAECTCNPKPPPANPRYRLQLDDLAQPVAAAVLAPDGIGGRVRRIFEVRPALLGGRMVARVIWAIGTAAVAK